MKEGVVFVICVLVFNIAVESFPNPEEDLHDFDALKKRVEKIKTGLDRVSQIVKDMDGNGTATLICLPPVLGRDVKSETTSVIKIVKGKSVTVNETTWIDGEGEEVAFYRVSFRKPMVTVSREEVDSQNAASPEETPMKQEATSN